MTTLLSTRLSAIFRKRAVQRALIGVSALLLVFTVFGYIVLPSVVKSELEKLAPEKLHRQLSIGAVDINPFALAVTLRDLKLKERDSDTVFASFDALTVNLSTQSIFHLAPVVQQVRLSKPYLHLVRKDAHRYNVDDILDLIANQPPSDEPSRFSVYNIQLEEGRIVFEDKPVGTTHNVTELKLGVPFISSLPSQVQVFVEPLLSAKVNGTPLAIQGKVRPFADPLDAVVVFDLRGHDIAPYLGYLPFKPQIRMPAARLDVQLTASFQQPKNRAPALMLNGSAALKALQIKTTDDKPVLKVPEISVELRNTNVFGDRFEVAKARVNGLEGNLLRDREGLLNVQRLLPATAPVAAPAARRIKEPAGPRIALGELEMRGATLRYTDEYGMHPMQAGVEKLDLTVRNLTVDPRKKTISVRDITSAAASLRVRENRPGANAAPAAAASHATDDTHTEAPYTVDIGRLAISNWSAHLEDHRASSPITTTIAPLSLSAEGISTASSTPARVALQATLNKTGQLALHGELGLAPFQTELAVNAKGVDLIPFQPYIADKVNLRFSRASLTTTGKLQLHTAKDGTLKGGFNGDITLGNLAAVDKLSGNDFLRWKSLFIGGMDMQLSPLALTMGQVALSDFFARVIIDSQGRINLQDILRHDEDDHKSLTEEAVRATAARSSARSVASAAQASDASGDALKAPPIAIRKLILQGGRVRFTDNFIKPNYSATLADFGGVVTQLSSDPASHAGIELHGLVNGAPLTAAGSINPLKGNLFLDIKANVRGMELAPLSAYSGRYVGYGIDKGKLSFEVAYRVENRQLTADNRLILDQLTFGAPIESPTATKLPVQFAVALLRDGNGIIDINLPIGGSLDDPEFSVGGVLIKVFFNALAKAVAQPFKMLGALFGSDAELSSLELDPGRAAIPSAGEEKLKLLAKALTDRPALKLDITGRFDPEADRAGLKRVAVERKVRVLKINDMRARGETPEPGSVVVKADEYRDLLTRAYRDEKFPKPRNLAGLPKDLPVEEMEKLMIANADIDEDDLIALGNQRAQAVKNWLEKNGQVPAERIFVLAPKVATQESNGKETIAPHRVDFSLR